MSIPSDPSIRELLERANAGDSEAREELFRAVEQPVLEIVRRRMGQRLRGAAESIDIAQSALYEACRGLDRFDYPSEPKGNRDPVLAWLAQVVENKLRNRARYLRVGDRNPNRRTPIEPGTSESPGFDIAASSLGASSAMSKDEERDQLLRVLKRLPERELQLVRLRNLEQLAWAEVVERAGEDSVRAAQACHARAMARLSGWLTDDSET